MNILSLKYTYKMMYVYNYYITKTLNPLSIITCGITVYYIEAVGS